MKNLVVVVVLCFVSPVQIVIFRLFNLVKLYQFPADYSNDDANVIDIIFRAWAMFFHSKSMDHLFGKVP